VNSGTDEGKKPMTKKSVTFRFSDDTLAVLKSVSEQYGISQSRLAEDGVRRELVRIMSEGNLQPYPEMPCRETVDG
jgi:hypothetical protein